MKKNLTELVQILDRSGSMSGLVDDTIGGYNTFIDQQKEIEGEAVITTVLFDEKIENLHFRKDLNSVSHITNKEYFARGTTAMLDAIGNTINAIGDALNNLPEDERPERVLFVITTDGYENASKEFSYDKVKSMIEHQKEKYGWEFMFIGANIDAAAVSGQIGISANMSANYTASADGTRSVYTTLSNTAAAYRTKGTVSTDWASGIK